jgi:hypothetical protein
MSGGWSLCPEDGDSKDFHNVGIMAANINAVASVRSRSCVRSEPSWKLKIFGLSCIFD